MNTEIVSILILIIGIQVFVIFHYAGEAKLARRIASERYDQIRALELELRAHLPPAELAELEEYEAEAEAIVKESMGKGPFS
jgi:hypothetical protein